MFASAQIKILNLKNKNDGAKNFCEIPKFFIFLF